jgi:hypothetical protein
MFTSGLYATVKTQLFQLKEGWNSIYLEVDPEVENLSDFIGETPIEIITSYFPTVSSVEYISNEDETSWKKPSWNRWINPDMPEHFLSNLFGLSGGRGYLVKASEDCNWSVEGEAILLKKRWDANSFNLMGFEVSEIGPAFYGYLDTNLQPVYRLVDGRWSEVNLIDTEVQKGEAYWVFAKDGSNFQGKFEIEIGHGNRDLDFGTALSTQTLYFTNRAEENLTIHLDFYDSTAPLSLVENNVSDTFYTPVSGQISFIVDDEEEIQFTIRREEMDGNVSGLLRVTAEESYEERWISIKGEQ